MPNTSMSSASAVTRAHTSREVRKRKEKKEGKKKKSPEIENDARIGTKFNEKGKKRKEKKCRFHSVRFTPVIGCLHA